MSRFESGHELARVTASVNKRTFSLSWKALPESEYQTLKSFFISQGTESFDWTHPIDNVTVKVRFADPELDSTIPYYNHRSVSVLFHEVL